MNNRLIFYTIVTTLILASLALLVIIYNNKATKEDSKTSSKLSEIKGTHGIEEIEVAKNEAQGEQNRQSTVDVAASIGSPSGTNWSLKYETEGPMQGYFRIAIDAKNDLETFKKARDESFAVFKNTGYDPCGENLKGTISIEPSNMPQNTNLTTYNPC